MDYNGANKTTIHYLELTSDKLTFSHNHVKVCIKGLEFLLLSVSTNQNSTAPCISLGDLTGDTGQELSILGEMFSKAFFGLQREIDLSEDTLTGADFLVGRETLRILALCLPFIRIVTFNSSGEVQLKMNVKNLNFMFSS